MKRKPIFTKEKVVEAAFSLAQAKGWAAVTARSIARRLGSSTMPIYSSLRSMERIEREVRAKAEKLMLDYQRRPWTGDASVDVAVGYVMFAREEPNLFRFLYVDRPVGRAAARAGSRDRAGLVEAVSRGGAAVALADQVPVAMQDPRILKSWIFTHGLASMVSSGVLDLPDDRIRSLLTEAGGALFAFEDILQKAAQKRGKEGKEYKDG